MKKIITVVFFVLETVVYLLFMGIDIAGVLPDGIYYDDMWIKYYGIILCVLYAAISWFLYCRPNTKNGLRYLLVPLAVISTLCADFFLIFLLKFEAGVLIFCIAQFLYWFFLFQITGKMHIPLRCCMCLILLTAVYIFRLDSQMLNILAAIYFSILVSNCISAWTSKKTRIFAIGLTLFTGCDICVGLYNIPVHINPTVDVCIMIGMWFFYLPSQVVIVYSYKKFLEEHFKWIEKK